MPIGTDFSVAANGDIRHVANNNTYTVLELHRWLQDLADDPAAGGNDLVDITSSTPSERSTDNIITLLGTYNIDDDAAKYFYDGSVSQTGGDTLYSGLVVVGAVNQATTLQVVQNNTLYDGDSPFWGTGINAVPASNILSRMLIKTRDTGSDIDAKRVRVFARELGDTYAEFSVTMGLGNSVAAIFTNEDLNNPTDESTISGWSVSNTEGYRRIDLNNGNGERPYYSEWDKGGLTINQLYEKTKWYTRRGTVSTLYGLDGELFRGITHQILCDNPSATNFSTVEEINWSGGTGQLLAKVRADTGSGGIQIDVDDSTGTFTRQDAGNFLTDGFLPGMLVQFTGFTNPGNNVTKTISSVTTSTIVVTSLTGLVTETGSGDERALTLLIWMQLLTGIAPTDNQTINGVTSTATADVNVSIIARTLPPHILGTSTGTAIIGAYGVGVVANNLTVNDKVFDLNNVQQQPPNNVTFKVTGLVDAQDRVLVGPKAGGNDFLFSQLTLQSSLSSGSTTVVVTSAIPSDTPSSGTIRVLDDSGVYVRAEYSNWSVSTFNLSGTFGSTATAPKNVFISYIDDIAPPAEELAFTAVYGSDRSLYVRVRDGGGTPIKTFETPATFGGADSSIAAIRTPDA